MGKKEKDHWEVGTREESIINCSTMPFTFITSRAALMESTLGRNKLGAKQIAKLEGSILLIYRERERRKRSGR